MIKTMMKKISGKSFRQLVAGTVLTVFGSATLFQATAHANEDRFFFHGPDVVDILSSNGFSILLNAVIDNELAGAVTSSSVTVFAPTDDVFEATADLLCYEDAAALLGALDDGNLTADILKYHVVGKRLSERSLLLQGDVNTFLNASVEFGVDTNGFYVRGPGNFDGVNVPNITTDGISGRRVIVYPVSNIILPIDPTPLSLCES